MDSYDRLLLKLRTNRLSSNKVENPGDFNFFVVSGEIDKLKMAKNFLDSSCDKRKIETDPFYGGIFSIKNLRVIKACFKIPNFFQSRNGSNFLGKKNKVEKEIENFKKAVEEGWQFLVQRGDENLENTEKYSLINRKIVFLEAYLLLFQKGDKEFFQINLLGGERKIKKEIEVLEKEREAIKDGAKN